MPINTIGPWTLGKDLAFFTVAPATVAGTTWTVLTGVDYTGVVRRLNHQARVALKDIRPITVPQENMVPISVGQAIQITVLRKNNNTTPGNPLSALVATYGYCQVTFDDAHEEFSGFFAIGNYETGFDGNEEQIATIDLQPVALVGQPQMTRAFV
jgi:hypothetical protein